MGVLWTHTGTIGCICDNSDKNDLPRKTMQQSARAADTRYILQHSVVLNSLHFSLEIRTVPQSVVAVSVMLFYSQLQRLVPSCSLYGYAFYPLGEFQQV